MHNAIEDNYDVEYVGTSVFGFEITEALGTYLEGIAILRPDADEAALQFWAWSTYEVATDTVLTQGATSVWKVRRTTSTSSPAFPFVTDSKTAGEITGSGPEKNDLFAQHPLRTAANHPSLHK